MVSCKERFVPINFTKISLDSDRVLRVQMKRTLQIRFVGSAGNFWSTLSIRVSDDFADEIRPH